MEYKVKTMKNSAIYITKAIGHLPKIYYLIFWKGYSKDESTWELALAVMHLWKIVNTTYNNNLGKPITISQLIDCASPIAK